MKKLDTNNAKGDKIDGFKVIEVGKISGILGLDTRRIYNGKYPIALRISYNNKRASYIITKRMISKNEFKLLRDSKEKNLKDLRSEINDDIEVYRKAIKEIHKDGDYTHEKLRKKLRGGSWIYVNDAFNEKIKELEMAGKVGTLSSYSSCRNFFNKYSSNLTFADISAEWIQIFEQQSLNKLSQTSISIYLRYLRHLYNKAIKSGDIPRSRFPFDSKDKEGFKIKTTNGTKNYLNLDQLKNLVVLELNTVPLQRTRDLFLLSFYLGGIGIYDLLQLRWENVSYSKDGDEVTYNRQKTGVQVIAPIYEPTWEIIQRWGSTKKTSGYIFPFVNPKHTPSQRRDYVKKFTGRLNKKLKDIGNLIHVENLSSYVSRHTAANYLMNNNASHKFIQSIMGHKNFRTTEMYLHGLDSKQRREQSSILASIGKKEANNLIDSKSIA